MPVTVHTVAVQMPQQLYSRLERLAELSRRSLESVVLQTLDSNIPPLPDDLPDEMRSDLSKLENLGDEALWEIAQSTISLEQQQRMSELLRRNQEGTITEAERRGLAKLRKEADRLMLRKAYAYVLLKWRGHRLPKLDELEVSA